MNIRGLLYFPVTPYDSHGRVDCDVMAAQLRDRLPFEPGAVFPACGTGEFHALAADEVADVVRATVEVIGGAVPVIAGAGGPLGHALRCAREAEAAGADALLVLPPYLLSASPVDGLVAYVRAIADATRLPLIVYNRPPAVLTPQAVAELAADPRVMGVKDGFGDVGLVQQFALIAQASGRSDFLLFNGTATAEMTQAAYAGVGVRLYSSAAFAMAPEVAVAYHRACQEQDDELRRLLLTEFFAPLVRLRDQGAGLNISLIKAGVRLSGLPVGSVRPPLVDPDPSLVEQLAKLLAAGKELVGARAAVSS